MRVWEVDDAKALAGNMVREQDFIMRLRHLQRHGLSFAATNITFDALDVTAQDLALREIHQRQVTELAQSLGGECHVMSNGDLFTLVPLTQGKIAKPIFDRLTIAALPAGKGSADDIAKLVHVYQLPQDYAQLRERANHYVEAARAASIIGAANPSAERVLQSDSVRGPLTAWSLSQIERLLEELDVRRYVRSQNIYRRQGTRWSAIGAEYFVAVEDMRRERFPRLNIRTPERLFMELCAALDRRLLQQLADNPETLSKDAFNLNIAVETVMGGPFAKFCHAVPAAMRNRVGFELNRGDLFLDFATTRNAIAILRQEGFRVIIDALHPEQLPYLLVEKLQADFYKIRVTRELMAQLQAPEALQALRRLPPDKIIFYRCEHEAILEVGQKLGINLFQGWLIDDVVNAH